MIDMTLKDLIGIIRLEDDKLTYADLYELESQIVDIWHELNEEMKRREAKEAAEERKDPPADPPQPRS